MKNSNDNIGNRTRDLPTCSAVPQPTALPRAPEDKLSGINYEEKCASCCSFSRVCITMCGSESVKYSIHSAIQKSNVFQLFNSCRTLLTASEPARNPYEVKMCFFFHVLTVHLDIYQSFFSPTDAQLDNLKNNFKFALKLTLTLRRLMSYIYIYIYIYGAPILDVSRSHTTTQYSR